MTKTDRKDSMIEFVRLITEYDFQFEKVTN